MEREGGGDGKQRDVMRGRDEEERERGKRERERQAWVLRSPRQRHSMIHGITPVISVGLS